MSDAPDLSHIDFTEDFSRVIARARAKAGGYVLKDGEDAPTPEDRYAAHDQKMAVLIERVTAKVGRAEDYPLPEPAAARAPSAAETRLGWYIPSRHVGDTLENFRPVTPSQTAALEATRAWVDSVKQGEGGALALVGGVGTGKSHLLYAAVREVNLAGIHAAAARWYDLANLFKRAKFGGSEDYDGAVRERDRFTGAKAFGIDEIRPTSGTDYDVTELAHLMTGAYERMQGVIVTSNFADESLTRIIGMAATSRLTMLTIEGPDMRQPENKRKHLRVVA